MLLIPAITGFRYSRLTGFFKESWGSLGSQNGQLNSPRGIAIGNTGYVYVADFNNNRVQKFNPDGSFVTAWGSLGSANGQFNGPYYIAIDNNDNGAVYVTDSNNHRVQKFDSNGGFVGAWGSQGSGDGQFNVPKGICVYRLSGASVGYVFVVDSGNNRIQKFKVTIGSGTTTTAQGSSTTNHPGRNINSSGQHDNDTRWNNDNNIRGHNYNSG